MSMCPTHVTKTTPRCVSFTLVVCVRSVRWRDVAATLVSSLVISRRDYCIAVLAGLPHSTIAPLYNGSWTLLAGWCAIFALEITSSNHWWTCTGCQSKHTSSSNSACRCTRRSTSVRLPWFHRWHVTLRSATNNYLAVPRTRLCLGERAFSADTQNSATLLIFREKNVLFRKQITLYNTFCIFL